ncbi:MAG: hypothetical protein AAGG79_00525, partial [Pseudomonadota bacterium]
MSLSSDVRNGLLLGAAALVIAACEGGGSVENTGSVAPINVEIGTAPPPATGDGAVDLTTTACPSAAPEGVINSGGVAITACIIPTNIPLTGNVRLPAGNAYGFSGSLFVGTNVVGTANTAVTGVLSIDPGVVVFGASGEDALVINPGSQIQAIGTPANPIIFTSASDLEDADAASDRTAFDAASDGLVGGSPNVTGQWGGIVINGTAPINACDLADVGTINCIKEGEGNSGFFGGLDADDDSGSLVYARIQYPGFLFSTDDELNGLALQGVGNGTRLSFIHVHNSQDDAFEWFGGTVNADHIVVSNAGDDGFDWTDGWTGNVQFAVLSQDNVLSGDPRGIEGDSNEDNPGFAPVSSPIFANFTLVSTGPSTGDDGMKVRRGSGGIYANGIVSGFNGNGIDFDSSAGPIEPGFFSMYVAGSGSDATDSEATPIFDTMAGGDTGLVAGGNVRGGDTLPSIFSIDATRAVASLDLADGADDFTRLPATGITPVAYIGAFSDSVQAYEDSWLNGWALELPAFSGQAIATDCPEGTTASVNTSVPMGRTEARVCTISSPVAGNVFLPAGNLYELDGTVFVGTDAGADPNNPLPGSINGTLTIAAGVTVFGRSGPDALVVSRGSQIFVEGQSSAPVLMTSLQDISGLSTGPGQGGGLVLNGRAPINDCDASDRNTINCVKDGEGGSGFFGGLTSDDDSGRLNYLRVQYAGFLFGVDDELNGVAFQGVGSGTEIDYIQVHQNQDDGIEFFGGTANAKHLVVTNAGDDAFDWTDGWTGNVQYLILVEGAGLSGDPRGIEADSNGDAPDATPRSNPTIANATIISNDDPTSNQDAVKIRRGTDGSFYNWVIAGAVTTNADDGIDFDADSVLVEPDWFSSIVVDFGAPLVDVSTFTVGNNNVNATAIDADFATATGGTQALVPTGAFLAAFP